MQHQLAEDVQAALQGAIVAAVGAGVTAAFAADAARRGQAATAALAGRVRAHQAKAAHRALRAVAERRRR